MNRKLTKRLLIGGVVVGASGAGYLIYKDALKLVNVEVKKSKIELVSKNGKKSHYKVFLKLSNPSNLKLKLTNQQIDVYVNGVFILRLESDKIQVLEPKSISELVFDLNLDWDDLFTKIMMVSGQTIVDKLKFITEIMSQTLKLDIKLSVKWGILPNIPVDIPIEQNFKSWLKM